MSKVVSLDAFAREATAFVAAVQRLLAVVSSDAMRVDSSIPDDDARAIRMRTERLSAATTDTNVSRAVRAAGRALDWALHLCASDILIPIDGVAEHHYIQALAEATVQCPRRIEAQIAGWPDWTSGRVWRPRGRPRA